MPAFALYKPGQGYWTRVLTAVGAGVVVLAGVGWLWTELSVLRSDAYRLYIQAGVAVLNVAIFGWLVWWLVGTRHQTVDFMIATESEMRKVNWPSRRDLTGSTWLVICGTLLMAGLLFVVDIAFALLFQTVGVLEGG